jgi:hypothetical protein
MDRKLSANIWSKVFIGRLWPQQSDGRPIYSALKIFKWTLVLSCEGKVLFYLDTRPFSPGVLGHYMSWLHDIHIAAGGGLPLHCTALNCTALHCTALHCTALHCTALHCTALHYIHIAAGGGLAPSAEDRIW